jgi:aminopeptidase
MELHQEHVAHAAKNLSDILRDALLMQPSEQMLVIYDTQAGLARVIADAYRVAAPRARFVDFETVTPEQVREMFDRYKSGDLIVLVQSANFRLNEFRLRIELFARGLKNIEHVHLGRIPEDQWTRYIDALSYDKEYYHRRGHALKAALDAAQEIVVECEGTRLEYKSPMEDSKLNIGDYTKMKNKGGTFPIGEVFSEPKDLTKVNGTARIFGYAGDDHRVRIVEPFLVQVTDGIMTAPEAPVEFQQILELIKSDEEVYVREFGLGLSRGMGKHALVSDITAFERQNGLHLSLGAKHTIYKKPGMHRKKGRYHIDIFVDITRITIDERVIYEQGDFTL